jgi:hypothetical protein
MRESSLTVRSSKRSALKTARLALLSSSLTTNRQEMSNENAIAEINATAASAAVM